MIRFRKPTGLGIKVSFGYLVILMGVMASPMRYVSALYCFGALLLARDRADIICMLFAWISVSPIFKFTPGATSTFTYLELLAIGKLFWMDRKINKRFLFCWLVYLSYLVVGMGGEYATFIKTVMMPMLLYLLTKEPNYDQLKQTSLYYIVGTLVGSVLGLCKAFIPNLSSFLSDYKIVNVSYSTVTGFSAEIRFSALWEDPNYYSIHLIAAIAICIILYLRKELPVYLFYGTYGVMTLFGAMTGSKSFLLMLVLVTIILMIGLFKDCQYRQLLFLLALVVGFLVLVMLGRVDLFSRVLARLENVNNSTTGLTTGRADLWVYYLNLFWENPLKLLVGNGLQRGFSYRPPHNTYIDFIDLLGLLGATLSAVVIIMPYFIMPKSGKGSGKVLFVILIMYFFLSMFYAIDFVFELAIAFSFCRIGPVAEGLRKEDVDEESYRPLQYKLRDQ